MSSALNGGDDVKAIPGKVFKPKGVIPVTAHPAPFSAEVLNVIKAEFPRRTRRIDPPEEWLDPFAGTGRVHELAEPLSIRTVGVEIEPEWAACHPDTYVGDSTALPKSWTAHFAGAITSPVFGNRMSDHHDAQERCKACDATGRVARKKCERCDGKGIRDHKRITYRHKLGRELHENNAGRMQWGAKYRDLHEQVWRELYRVLKPSRRSSNGRTLFFLDIKDHERAHQMQAVTDWHEKVLQEIGFDLVASHSVDVRGMGFGQNRDARAENEWVLVFDRGDRAA